MGSVPGPGRGQQALLAKRPQVLAVAAVLEARAGAALAAVAQLLGGVGMGGPGLLQQPPPRDERRARQQPQQVAPALDLQDQGGGEVLGQPGGDHVFSLRASRTSCSNLRASATPASTCLGFQRAISAGRPASWARARTWAARAPLSASPSQASRASCACSQASYSTPSDGTFRAASKCRAASAAKASASPDHCARSGA